MESILAIVAAKAVIATVLAIVAAVGARYLRRPGLVHSLWLIVLLELLGPPVFRVGILPAVEPLAGAARRGTPEDRAAARTAAAPFTKTERVPERLESSPLRGEAPDGPAGGEAARGSAGDDRRRAHASHDLPAPGAAHLASASTRFSGAARPGPGGRVAALIALLERAAPALALLWGAGALGVLVLAAVRWQAFRRHVLASQRCSQDLQRRAERLAAGMGLSRCPEVRAVESVIPPMVGWSVGRLEIFFPEELARRLTSEERDALLAHELAHVARRDHWVRFLELGAASAFWWHPVSWWARRGLRRAEERACDERVLESMPGLARSYAAAMLETVEFLTAADAARVPVLVSGLDEFTNLKERLTMILDDPSTKRSSRLQRWSLAAGAAALVLSFPTWAERPASGTDPGESAASSSPRLSLIAAAPPASAPRTPESPVAAPPTAPSDDEDDAEAAAPPAPPARTPSAPAAPAPPASPARAWRTPGAPAPPPATPPAPPVPSAVAPLALPPGDVIMPRAPTPPPPPPASFAPGRARNSGVPSPTPPAPPALPSPLAAPRAAHPAAPLSGLPSAAPPAPSGPPAPSSSPAAPMPPAAAPGAPSAAPPAPPAPPRPGATPRATAAPRGAPAPPAPPAPATPGSAPDAPEAPRPPTPRGAAAGIEEFRIAGLLESGEPMAQGELFPAAGHERAAEGESAARSAAAADEEMADAEEPNPSAAAGSKDEQLARERKAQGEASRTRSTSDYELALRAMRIRRAEFERKIHEYERKQREFAAREREFEAMQSDLKRKFSEAQRKFTEEQRKVEAQAEKLARTGQLSEADGLRQEAELARAEMLEAERLAQAEARSGQAERALADRERAQLELERSRGLTEGQNAEREMAELARQLELLRDQQGQSLFTQDLERELGMLRERLQRAEGAGAGSRTRSRAAMERDIAAIHRALALKEKSLESPERDQAVRELRERLRELEEQRSGGDRVE